MPSYKKCSDTDENVAEMARSILEEFESHLPVLHAGVKIDFLFAYPDLDKNDQPKNDAITKGGMKALGLCRKIPLKDRVKGNGDAEILIDFEWWENAIEEERRALLDHELHHIAIRVDDRGLVRDKAGRPVLNLRKHDVEVGWFMAIAARHGKHSLERLQAAQIMCDNGQYFWPEISAMAKAAEPKTRIQHLETAGA